MTKTLPSALEELAQAVRAVNAVFGQHELQQEKRFELLALRQAYDARVPGKAGSFLTANGVIIPPVARIKARIDAATVVSGWKKPDEQKAS